MWISYIYFYTLFYICIAEVAAARRHGRRVKENVRSKQNNCWMTLGAKKHFVTMEELEEKYAKARNEFDEQQVRNRFDEEMLGNLLDNQGAANREVQKAGNQKNMIPSGINLGGHSMLRMPDSVMFFHRLKLRNDTRFRVNYLSSNFSTMTMTSRVSLNDLHLVGNYERVQTKEDPSLLLYQPNYGQIEVLLRDVIYKIEGRYRLQKDMIYLEMVLSELYVPYDGILMLHTKSSSEQQQSLQTINIADFLDRLKNDLDLWMKDFFNEFLLEHTTVAIKTQFMKYDKKRIRTLNRYVDRSLEFLKLRLKTLKADVVKLPSFTITAFNGIELQLKHGSLTGLDTMYRRSMATNSVDRDVRKVDALIAFSSLKARYSYEVKLTTRAPPLFGSLILSGDELSAIMSISMVKKPLFVDLTFDFIQQLKPQFLIVEGSVGRLISAFKHMLELHILAIMTNTMIDQVKQLSTLAKCVPTLKSYVNDEFQDRHYYEGIETGSEEMLVQLPAGCKNRDCMTPCAPGSSLDSCTFPTNTTKGLLSYTKTTKKTIPMKTTTKPTKKTTTPTKKTTKPTKKTTTPTKKTTPAKKTTTPTKKKTTPTKKTTTPTKKTTTPTTTTTKSTTTTTSPTTKTTSLTNLTTTTTTKCKKPDKDCCCPCATGSPSYPFPTLKSYVNDEVQDRNYYEEIEKGFKEKLMVQRPADCKNRDCMTPCAPGSPFYPCTFPTNTRSITRRTYSYTTRPITTRTRLTRTRATPTTKTTIPMTKMTTPTIKTTTHTTTTTTPTTTTTKPTTTTTKPTTTTTKPTTTTTKPTTTTTKPTTTTTTPTTTTTTPTTTTTTPTTTTTTPTTTTITTTTTSPTTKTTSFTKLTLKTTTKCKKPDRDCFPCAPGSPFYPCKWPNL